MTFRRFRILILLGVLVAAVGLTWLEQSLVRSWRAPLDVAVMPINGDGSPEATEMIRTLKTSDFDDINAFLERESARYGARLSPAMQLTLLPALDALPPAPPRDGSVLKTMLWSLQLRWWVYRQSGEFLPQLGTIKLFVLYHAPQDGVALEHSLGLQKGLIGVVHAFADPRQARQNNIVIAHELLHTLGATDKYGRWRQAGLSAGLCRPRTAAAPAAPRGRNHGRAAGECRRTTGDASQPGAVRGRRDDRPRNQFRRRLQTAFCLGALGARCRARCARPK